MMTRTGKDNYNSWRFWRFQFIRYIRDESQGIKVKPWRIRGNGYIDIYILKRIYVFRFQFTERDEDMKRFKNGA